MSDKMSKRELIKLCRGLGVLFTTDDNRYSIEAPPGYILSGPRTHEAVIFWTASWRMPDLYAELAEDLEMGIELCTDPECDWCLETGAR